MFNISRSTVSTGVVSDDYMKRYAPSIFAEQAHERTSNRYTYIPTIQIVNAMRAEGWHPVRVMESRVRDEAREGYQKHLIRFRHADSLNLNATQMTLGDSVPEIVLVNAHDGTSSYQLHGGLYRLVCHNGMIVADSTIEKITTKHSGDIIGNVIEGTYKVIDTVPIVAEKINEMRSLVLSEPEKEIFGRAALALRWEDGQAPINERQVVAPRRMADKHSDLWTMFNRTQENLVKGGVSGWTRTNKRTTTREVKSVNENVRLNKALWTLAEEFAKLKTS